MHARTALTAATSLALALGGAVGVAPSAVAANHVGEVDGVRYLVDDSDIAAGAVVLGSAAGGAPVDLVLPATVEVAGQTYDVTQILPFAFTTEPVTSVSVPHTVREIGAGAFMDAPVATLHLADGVTSIGPNAFYGAALTTVTIPDSVTTLGVGAFRGNALESVVVGAGVTSLPPVVFANNALTEVTLPDSVTSIDAEAFVHNATLRHVDVGDGVVSIGQGAFGGASGLTDLRLGGSVTTIGASAFQGSGLSEVAVPASVTDVGDSAFLHSDALARVRFAGPAPAVGFTAFPAATTLEYRWRHDASQMTGGFTTPTWQGWATEAIATLRWFTGPGDLLLAEELVVGAPLTTPSPPATPGMRFRGWFTDPALTVPLDLAAPVPGGLDLHAGWRADVAPTAPAIQATTTAGEPVAVALPRVDVHGEPLTVTTAAPSSGTVDCLADGVTCTYTPAPGFTGVATFAYTVTDTVDRSATGTVEVTVLAAPAPPTVEPPDAADGGPTVGDPGDQGAAPGASSALAATGAEAAPLVGAALAALVTGGLLLLLARRRAAS